jgi:hypothetical protein
MGGLYERAHIIRYSPPQVESVESRASGARNAPARTAVSALTMTSSDRNMHNTIPRDL